jgi:hypothetical protein
MFLNTLNISKPRKVVAKLILFLLIGLIAVGMDSCKKKPPTPPDCYDPANPDCVNYDPCYGKELPTADFLMEESVVKQGLDRVFIPEDSIFFGVYIRFRSIYEDEAKYTHTWYLGAETLDGYQIVRSFDKVTRPAFITVSHVIRYEPDTVCFPGDDGMDSVSRKFYLIKYYNELNVFGKYRGILENEIDSFDMEISYINENGDPAIVFDYTSNMYQRFINFQNNQDTITGLHYFLSPGNNIGFFYGSGGPTPKGSLIIDPATQKAKMEYRLKYQDFIFTGRKLN